MEDVHEDQVKAVEMTVVQCHMTDVLRLHREAFYLDWLSKAGTVMVRYFVISRWADWIKQRGWRYFLETQLSPSQWQSCLKSSRQGTDWVLEILPLFPTKRLLLLDYSFLLLVILLFIRGIACSIIKYSFWDITREPSFQHPHSKYWDL